MELSATTERDNGTIVFACRTMVTMCIVNNVTYLNVNMFMKNRENYDIMICNVICY